MMDHLFRNYDNIVAYIDDLLIHSKDWAGHLEHLRVAFRILKENGLKLNLDKCRFGQAKVSYLGHTISGRGVAPGIDKTKALREAPAPRTTKEVRQFLGLANFFRAYIPHFSECARPLFALTRQQSEWKSGPLPEEARQAFEALKENLTRAPVLAFPRTTGEFQLYTDASGGVDGSEGAFGAALIQIQDGKKRVIAFASRKLQRHETNYSAFLLEQAAVVFGVEHFRQYLVGRKFTLFTDHKPITNLSKIHKKTFSRFTEILHDFNFEIRYVPGKENTVADYLSRASWIMPDQSDGLGVAQLDEGRQRIKAEQFRDELCISLRRIKSPRLKQAAAKRLRISGWREDNGVLKIIPIRREHFPDDGPRIVAPKSMHPHLIKQGHDALIAGHGGFFKTRERIAKDYWWPGMDADVREHIRQCEPCRMAGKQPLQSKPGIRPLPQPQGPNHRVHMDLFGPLRNGNGDQRYVLVITDAFTKIVRLASIPDKRASTIAAAVRDNWVYIFGAPRMILTDQGKEFCNEAGKAFWRALGVSHKTTTPYHPRTNAQAEVFNKTMANYLRTAIAAGTRGMGEWETLLGPLMLAHNTAVHKATRRSPFYSLFGYDPNIPLWEEGKVFDGPLAQQQQRDMSTPAEEFAAEFRRQQQRAREVTKSANEAYREAYSKPSADESGPLTAGQLIWLRCPPHLGHNAKLYPRWEKAEILERTHPDVYKVRRFQGRRRTKTVNREAIRTREPENEATSQGSDVEHEEEARAEDENVDGIRRLMTTNLPLWLSRWEIISPEDLKVIMSALRRGRSDDAWAVVLTSLQESPGYRYPQQGDAKAEDNAPPPCQPADTGGATEPTAYDSGQPDGAEDIPPRPGIQKKHTRWTKFFKGMRSSMGKGKNKLNKQK